MITFFDTSVLIPVFLEAHEHHALSLRVFLKAEPPKAFCSSHGLVEFYSTLTRLPGSHRLSGEQVLLILGDIRQRLTVESLTAEETWKLLEDAATRGITGGMAYDFIQARCALKTHATVLYTWNTKHFSRLGKEVSAIARTP
jgi:predicted nucleic acid-binding protein